MAINVIKVYCDMDGVLCAFEEQVKKLGEVPAQGLADDATEEQKQAMYDAIEEAKEDFWATMPWTENGKKLWKILKPYKPVILSSPGKFLYAPAGKNTWMNKNLPGVTYFLEEDKWVFVEPESVLIDDMEKNIRDWDAAGGFGILYKGDPEEVKTELKEFMEENKLYKEARKPLFVIDKDSIVKSGDNEYFYCCTTPPHPSGLRLPDRKRRYVYLHRALMELQLGRFLRDGEEVHHKDNNRKNNKPSNLELVKFKKHQKDHSHKTKFWKKSPRNKPGRQAALNVVNSFCHKANYVSAVSIPTEWKKQLKEKNVTEDTSKGLLKEKADSILNKIDTRDIREPHLFLRALNKTINYITKMPDPSKHGLLMDLTKYANDITPKIRKEGKLTLNKEFQKDIIHKAEKLKDDGGLLKYLEELFTEKYKRASIADALRRIAKVIYLSSVSSRQ